jgi:hypothetical protein
MVGIEEIAAIGRAPVAEAAGVAEGGVVAELVAGPASVDDVATAIDATAPTVNDEADTTAVAPAEEAGDDVSGTASESEEAGRWPAPRRRFALRRRTERFDGTDDGAPEDAASESESGGDHHIEAAGESDELAAPPAWQFGALPAPEWSAETSDGHGIDDAVPEVGAIVAQPDTVEAPAEEPAAVAEMEVAAAEDIDTATAEVAEAPTAEVGDPAIAAATDHAAEAPQANGFVAPRAGFHILEDGHPDHSPADAEASPLAMPAFAADEIASNRADSGDGQEPAEEPSSASETAHVEPAPGPESPRADPEAEFLSWPPAPPVAGIAVPAAAEKAAHMADAGELEPVAAALAGAHAEDPEDTEPGADKGWRVRGGDDRAIRGGGSGAEAEEDPFENNPKLAEIRRRIDERLRRKRCDEAAALLQELAQETGGRVVADLAMNAGDRCRALGKSNAALNCYLAASRSDPVYEKPLSRLADICIDDQDPELAVSYLERIARLCRYRGDDKAALRVYRRIATIAPYREDVLAILLNAQNTGRFEA